MSDERLSSAILEVQEVLNQINEEREIAAVESRSAVTIAEENYALGYSAAHEATTEKLDKLMATLAAVY
jgi:hypothetical protein